MTNKEERIKMLMQQSGMQLVWKVKRILTVSSMTLSANTG